MNLRVKYPFSLDHVPCQPKLFLLSAPAGVGKSTIVRMLMEEFPNTFEKTVSTTTRSPRDEQDRRDYEFVDKSEFESRIHQGFFLEWVQLFDHYYGTASNSIDHIMHKGKHAFAVIDVEGAMRIKSLRPAVSIFLLPPSLEVLQNRLVNRGSENLEHMRSRLARAEQEMQVAQDFDYQLINDDLSITYAILKSILVAEEHKSIQ